MRKRSALCGRILSFAAFVLLFGGGCGRRTPQSEIVESGVPTVSNQPSPASRQGLPLPDSAFRVRWGKHNVPSTLPAGATVPLAVTVMNESPVTWPDPITADASQSGAYAVRLAYRWLGASDATSPQEYQPRVELPRPLNSGESVTLTVPVVVPGRPGSYRLQFDLVQEFVAWFETKGAPKLIIPITVQ